MRYMLLFLCSLLFIACENLNSGWEIDGGGYVKFKLNEQTTYELEYEANSVILPTTNRHFILAQTKEDSSGHSLIFMVYSPKLGKNNPVSTETYFSYASGPKASLTGDSNSITIDQKDDSTWTADLDLSFIDCRSGECLDSLPPVHLTGRFRYWLPEEE